VAADFDAWCRGSWVERCGCGWRSCICRRRLGLLKFCRCIRRERGRAGGSIDFRSSVTAFERNLVSEALARNQNNWAADARDLRLDRANLNRLAKRLGLK
jgi:transcriptional regulator with GAF, ATPase, and Fis domain